MVAVLVVSSSSLAVAGALAVAPAAAATTTDLALEPGDRTVTAGESVTYNVTVGSVSGGVGSYDLTVSLDDTATARITGASSAIGGQAETTVDDGAAAISVFSADTVDSGSDVTVARVTVTGEAAGNATLSVDPESISDESGTQYTVASTSGAGLTVEPLAVGDGTTLSLDPADRSVAPNESATYNVTVAAVSGGVGSYDLSVSTSNASIAQITDVADATGGTTQASVDDATASIDAAGGDTVDAGTGVTIARVTVTGEAAGNADLTVEPRALANETGAAYAIDGTEGATVTVRSSDGGGGNGTTGLALAPSERSATVGESTTYEVTVGSVSGGVGSYDLTVSTSNASVARITGGASTIGGSERTNGDGTELQIAAFAGDTVDSGSDVAIARVTVTGEAAGNATLSVDPESISDESGTQYTVASTSGADLTVEPLAVGDGTTLSLDPADRSVAPNESATYNVTVGAVSGGVGSYDLSVSLDDTATARITGVADATGGTTQASVDDATASIDAAGGDTVDAGTGVTIARVTVTGEAAGSATLSLDQRYVRNETGAAYAIDATNGAGLTVGSGSGGGDGEKATALSFDPVEREIAPNESATYNVTVGTVSDGVGSYTLNVSLDDGSVARITGVSDAIGGAARTSVGETEAKIGAFTGDTVDSGSNVTIARVTVTGEAAGNATLSVDPESISDENGGDQYTITATTDATVDVRTTRAPDVVGEGNRATDPDGDGLYEDVNGDGEATPGDASVLFNAVFDGNEAVTDNVALFDFSGDGAVTTGDAGVLFNEFF